jgi:acyl phosphate:glycerol-3-phosphate acyltransferase
MDTLLPLIVGYGVGSLPLGYLIASGTMRIDLRTVGSGNVGAANVHRTAGLSLALLVVCLDVAKGAGSVLIAARVTPGAVGPIAAGVAAIIGHAYPVWLRFRGGKGVATACGVFWILAPTATSIAAVAFIATVWATRYVSLGSLVATVALPLLAWMTSAPATVVVGGIVAALLILERHRDNLARLHHGTERRFGQKA